MAVGGRSLFACFSVFVLVMRPGSTMAKDVPQLGSAKGRGWQKQNKMIYSN